MRACNRLTPTRINPSIHQPHHQNSYPTQTQPPNHQAIEGAFGSVTKILEDAGHALRGDESGYGPEVLNRLAGALPAFFHNEDPGVRAAAIRGMNLLVPLKPAQLAVGMQGFIQGLAMLKDDPDPRVRRGVCQALVALFREGCDHLLEKLGEIMDFMLAKTQDAHEEVAREACEFWGVFTEFHGHEDLELESTRQHRQQRRRERIPEMLRAFLPRLVPVLLRGMAFSVADREAMLADAKLQLDSVPDRPEDFEPVHLRGRGGGGGGGEEEDDDEEDDDGEAGGGGGGGAGGAVQQWNLRRCSAATLDNVAEFFGPGVVLPVLLPLLGEKLQHGDVWDREACILALGAVSSCVQGMDEHLPQLFPFLLQQLDDPAALQACPELGCTVVWTLSRYARWILARENDATFLSPLVERVLRTMLDRNKRVQQAACSALATLEEEGGPRLLPYLPHVLSFMAEAMGRYQTRSLVVLLDALGTLADALRHELAKPEFTAVFMPKVGGAVKVVEVIGRWVGPMCLLIKSCSSVSLFPPQSPHPHIPAVGPLAAAGGPGPRPPLPPRVLHLPRPGARPRAAALGPRGVRALPRPPPGHACGGTGAGDGRRARARPGLCRLRAGPAGGAGGGLGREPREPPPLPRRRAPGPPPRVHA